MVELLIHIRSLYSLRHLYLLILWSHETNLYTQDETWKIIDLINWNQSAGLERNFRPFKPCNGDEFPISQWIHYVDWLTRYKVESLHGDQLQ